MTNLQFPFQLDLEALRAEVASLHPDEFIFLDSTKIEYGLARAVQLIQPLKDQPQDEVKVQFEPTERLKQLPYLHSLDERFPGRKENFRLQKLMPGGVIREHKDIGRSWESGLFRIHIPIETNPGCEFNLSGESIALQAGECWYIDITLPHWVANHGETERIHLIIDCERNEWWENAFKKAGFQSTVNRWSI